MSVQETPGPSERPSSLLPNFANGRTLMTSISQRRAARRASQARPIVRFLSCQPALVQQTIQRVRPLVTWHKAEFGQEKHAHPASCFQSLQLRLQSLLYQQCRSALLCAQGDVCCRQQVLETVPDLSPMADEQGYFSAGNRSGSRSRRRTASTCSDDAAPPPAPIAEHEAEAEAAMAADEGEAELHLDFLCRNKHPCWHGAGASLPRICILCASMLLLASVSFLETTCICPGVLNNSCLKSESGFVQL